MKTIPFRWGNGFENWDTWMLLTEKDNHCFFHSLLLAISPDYIHHYENDNQLAMRRMAILWRKILAKELIRENKGITKYHKMFQGNIFKISNEFREYSLEMMKKKLESEEWIDYVYFDFMSNEIDRDIFILDWENKSIYKTLDENIRIKNRIAIILIYIDQSHYNLMAIKTPNGLKTEFEHDHAFILFLKSFL